MYRFALDYLKRWQVSSTRKPLIIRGARQVGKSYLVRMFAENFENCLEINFERDVDTASIFKLNDPAQICRLLETRFEQKIIPGKSLLFLDELQAAPSVFTSLRYFYEKMPDLHVIAAGSLLEFVLEQHTFSMPVGRVEYLHFGPMLFEEFLVASGREKLHEFIRNYTLDVEMPEAIHAELNRFLRQYLAVGGMPEVVQVYTETGSLYDCDAVKQSLLSTYQDDFGKYGTRVRHDRLRKVFLNIPGQIGQKFKYANVDREERSVNLGRALHMLCLARVAYPVRHTSANGLPLGAEADDRNFKALFLDVGLLCRSLGLSLLDFEKAEDVMLVNTGAVCEQFVGQHLLASREFFEDPELYFWMRQKRNSSAEVDYIISVGQKILPVEVKAGKSGTLKSLHLFLREKKCDLGVRLNSEPPSLMSVQTNLPDGDNKPYRLLSLPLYMVGQLKRLSSDIL